MLTGFNFIHCFNDWVWSRFSVDGGSVPFIFTDFRLPTIYFSTVSPSPLTRGFTALLVSETRGHQLVHKL